MISKAFLIALASFFLLLGCSEDPGKKFYGKWQQIEKPNAIPMNRTLEITKDNDSILVIFQERNMFYLPGGDALRTRKFAGAVKDGALHLGEGLLGLGLAIGHESKSDTLFFDTMEFKRAK